MTAEMRPQHAGDHRLELIGLAKSGSGAVQRELRRLQANCAAPIFTELRGIMLKTVGLADAPRIDTQSFSASSTQ